jgi:hypothetical protein
MQLHLITCVGVEADLGYLPHFLAHYAAMGVAPANIHILSQATRADHAGLDAADEIARTFDVPPARRWIATYTSRSMWEQRRALQKDKVAPSDFVISADVDEFHEYPVPPAELCAWCSKAGYEVIQGPFIDRIAANGRLADLPPPGQSIFDTYPVQTELRHTLAGITDDINLGGSVKLMLFRGSIEPGLGGHGTLPEYRGRPHALGMHLSRFLGLEDPQMRFDLPFLVHHFKWTAGVDDRMRKRLRTPGISPAGKAYAERLLEFFDGADEINTDALSIRNPDRNDPENWRKSVEIWRRKARVQQLRERWWAVKNRVRKLARVA